MIEGLLGIEHPDEPVYRIFPLWYFEEALRLRQLILVAPQQWEDPFEILASSIMMVDQRTTPWRQQSLETFLLPVYAQCWSRTQESDTLLRAYSRVNKDTHFGRNTDPRHEGVRVRTSPRKLIGAARSWAATLEGVSCYLGAVRYGTRDQILQYAANLIDRHGPAAVGRGHLRADLLLFKRTAFAHEAEIRLMCVDDRGINAEGQIRLPIEPNEVFEEVSFDPRLAPFERIERETIAKSLGYAGPFRHSDLYQRTLLEVILPNGWKDR